MEYTVILECVQDFVKYLCDSDEKKYGKYKDYEIEEIDIISMRLIVDRLYSKFILSGSYSISTSSPVVYAYNHLSKMLDRAIKNNLETTNQELKFKALELEKEILTLKKEHLEMEEKMKEGNKGWF